MSDKWVGRKTRLGKCYMLKVYPKKTGSGVAGLQPKVGAMGVDDAAYGENRDWTGSVHRNP